jgi:hypothetical protein
LGLGRGADNPTSLKISLSGNLKRDSQVPPRDLEPVEEEEEGLRFFEFITYVFYEFFNFGLSRILIIVAQQN